MSTGKFWVHRNLFSSDLFTEEKANDTSAWIDLIGMAAYKPKYIKIRDVRVPIQRGEIGHAIEFYAKRWGWSNGKVRRFFKHLEGCGMIKRHPHKSTITTIISIPNYNKYQSNSTADSITDRPYKELSERASKRITDGIQLNKDNNIKEIKESIISKNDVVSNKQEGENIKINKFLEIWNSFIPNREYHVKKLSKARQDIFNSRLNFFANYHESIEQTFKHLCKNIASSDFLNGKNRNGKPSDWDWVMKSDDQWLKILEGNYANHHEQKSIKQESTPLMNKSTFSFGDK